MNIKLPNTESSDDRTTVPSFGLKSTDRDYNSFNITISQLNYSGQFSTIGVNFGGKTFVTHVCSCVRWHNGITNGIMFILKLKLKFINLI